MDKEKVKKALDDFEEEQYVDSKETLRSEIKKKVNSYLKDKTGVENDPVDVSDEYEEKDENEDEE